jgi:pimeloyl-ACP methyl ester carboxylesterase
MNKFDVQGTEVAVRLAGDRTRPALLLLHGFPGSSTQFATVMEPLAAECFVIAPDLPGFGASAPIEPPTFARFADVIDGLLGQLGVASYHLYLNDFGAIVGLYLATRAPARIRSLVVQNANAHETGMAAAGWDETRAYWADPTPERAAAATKHLTYENTRAQYVEGIPADVAAKVKGAPWDEDWRILSLPGRLAMQRALVLDMRSHYARFGEIARYLRDHQPPALMLWGRHDVFFSLPETLSWMEALPRMEAHILDGSHFLLESHAAECAALMTAFLRRLASGDRAHAGASARS